MTTYMEAVLNGEDESAARVKKDDAIHASVCAALDKLDEFYPQFRRSAGPMGDKLAAALHRTFESAFNEIDGIEKEELTSLNVLARKYPRQTVTGRMSATEPNVSARPKGGSDD